MRLVVASVVMIVLSAGSVSADTVLVDLGVYGTGARDSDGHGVTATEDWDEGDFTIRWEITQQPNGLYHYTYWIEDLEKSLSHWNLQISDGVGLSAFSDFVETYVHEKDDIHYDDAFTPELGTHSSGNGNPGIPGDLYGLKWDTPNVEIEIEDDDESKFEDLDAREAHFEFDSTQPPVWGNFYAKSGGGHKDDAVIAYNDDFLAMPTSSTTDFTGWIPRPDGDTPVVPLPPAAAAGAVCLGLLGLVRAVRRR